MFKGLDSKLRNLKVGGWDLLDEYLGLVRCARCSRCAPRILLPTSLKIFAESSARLWAFSARREGSIAHTDGAVRGTCAELRREAIGIFQRYRGSALVDRRNSDPSARVLPLGIENRLGTTVVRHLPS